MQQTENDILKRVRKIEIKTRGLSNEIFAGKVPYGFPRTGHVVFRSQGSTARATT